MYVYFISHFYRCNINTKVRSYSQKCKWCTKKLRQIIPYVFLNGFFKLVLQICIKIGAASQVPQKALISSCFFLGKNYLNDDNGILPRCVSEASPLYHIYNNCNWSVDYGSKKRWFSRFQLTVICHLSFALIIK